VRGSASREIVAFAAALVVVPPAVLLSVELVVGLVSRGVMRALHLLFVVGLAVLTLLQVTKRIDLLPAWVAVGCAVALALAAGLLYARTRLLPTILTVLAPAPLVFLLLFLITTPVSKLVFVEDVAVRTAAVRSSTPVVLIVFDEFSTVGLLDARRRIDAARFPNFAALARSSNWYRDATTVYAHTEKAVPAILTGRVPSSDQLPVYADHPRNLFTLLGGRYRMNVLETLTHLCPRKVCTGKTASFQPEAVVRTQRTESLVSDAGIVYLHVLLPQALTGRLPPISDTWTNFRGERERDEETEERACGRKICAFTAGIAASRRPSLSFLHSLLPHVPWQYLPLGRRYANEVRRLPGIDNARWGRDAWLLEQGYQRYLLQLGYTDSALGVVMQRLRDTGLYDRALIVVTADHGAAFTAGEPRRVLTAGNLQDLALVPLFVKLPRQRTGRTVDGVARSVDIVPTIVDALNIRTPWRFDGRSLLRRLPRDGRVVVGGNAGSFSDRLSSLVRRQRAVLSRQLAWFGSGSFERVYRIGADRRLIGRPVTALQVTASGGARANVNGASLLRDVDVRSDLVPNYLTGTVSGARSSRESLAIAVNGVVAAVTRTYSWLGQTRFAAMISPSALRPGENSVAVYAIRGVTLEPLGGEGGSFTLERRDGRPALVSGTRAVPVVPGALRGDARAQVRPETVLFGGWAVDVRARRAADAVVVLVGGSSVYVGNASNYARPDIERRYGVQEAGFIFEVPRSAVGNDVGGVRIFVIRGAVASELVLRR
jgi:hypothetical protein